jgi:hypothetical protein
MYEIVYFYDKIFYVSHFISDFSIVNSFFLPCKKSKTHETQRFSWW